MEEAVGEAGGVDATPPSRGGITIRTRRAEGGPEWVAAPDPEIGQFR